MSPKQDRPEGGGSPSDPVVTADWVSTAMLDDATASASRRLG